jgi:hypothetical protein
MQKFPHHRSPVILSRKHEQAWLSNDLPLADVTRLLAPYPAELMNAYPIDPSIKNPRMEGPELIRPVGERIFPEYDIKKSRDISLQGMGTNKRLKEEGDFLEFDL